MFHGFDYLRLLTAAPAARMVGVLAAMEHIVAQQDGKLRFLQVVAELSKAFALSVPHDDAVHIRDEVASSRRSGPPL